MTSHFVLAMFTLAGCAYAQDASCRTPLGVPCHTIRGTEQQWQAFTYTPSEIRRVKTETVRATRRDGSSVSFLNATFEDMFGRAKGDQEFASMYLAPGNAIVTIDRKNQTIARREPLIWHDVPYRRSADNDSTCQSGIRHAGGTFHIDGTSTVAGVPVVKWVAPLANGGRDEEYLAPSLDCTVLKRYRIQRNALWLPTLIDSVEATSVTFGDPQASLFALPSGYREIEDPSRARMLRFLEANGNRGRLTPPR